MQKKIYVTLTQWTDGLMEGLGGMHTNKVGFVYYYKDDYFQLAGETMGSKSRFIKFWGEGSDRKYYFIEPEPFTPEYLKFWMTLVKITGKRVYTHVLYDNLSVTTRSCDKKIENWGNRKLDDKLFSFNKTTSQKDEAFLKKHGVWAISKQAKMVAQECVEDKEVVQECTQITEIKGNEMKETNVNVEVKVNGKVVAIGENEVAVAKSDFEAKTKLIGKIYQNGNSIGDVDFANKKEAKAWLQVPANLGKTLVLYRAEAVLTTNIPVVETKA